MKIGQGISTYKNIAVVARTSCITIADSKKIYNIRTIISYLYFVWIYFVIPRLMSIYYLATDTNYVGIVAKRY